MKHFIRKKALYIRLSEFFIVSALILFFSSDLISWIISLLPRKPADIDHWFFCYRLENQITRILGLNPGGIWEGGFCYPFHKVSILFDEPTWGVSLLVTPVWMITKNIFQIVNLAGIATIFLSWIFTYYLVRGMGGAKTCAFYASAMFYLSCISVSLIPLHIAFWPFFLIPLLGLITVKIFSTSRIYWGILWGVLFGYLAWSSAHLFVMGGLFLGLFILWNLLFSNHSKKTLLVLLIAFILSGIIAGPVLGSMYFTYKRFSFSRGYNQPFLYASNWANLFYKRWPSAPFNPITKTPFWEYLKTHAKGETTIGMSFLLLCSALIVFITRLKNSIPSHKVNKYSKYTLGVTIIISILFAFLNMHALVARSMECEGVLPKLATGTTYLCYIIAGIIIYFLRNRIRAAIKHLDFFLLLSAFLFGLITFGPYYLTENKSVIASPVAFLMYHVPGFSEIQATTRWGLLLYFTLSIGVAMFLSKYTANRRFKIFAIIFMLMSFLEVTPGFRMPELKNLSSYKWTPRETDVFLKNIPDNGAVLELESYPVEVELHLTSDNSLGYVLFSRLYHKKPLVTGYCSHAPHVMNKYIFSYPDGSGGMSLKTIDILRKFGAKYWVFHIDDWSLEQVQSLKDNIGGLKKMVELDSGKTLIYEDPNPKASVGYCDVK